MVTAIHAQTPKLVATCSLKMAGLSGHVSSHGAQVEARAASCGDVTQVNVGRRSEEAFWGGRKVVPPLQLAVGLFPCVVWVQMAAMIDDSEGKLRGTNLSSFLADGG